MTIADDLAARVTAIARERWETSAGRQVPDVRDLPFGNVGRTFEACFLYADLSDSTNLVQSVPNTLAAEYYKVFLHCASKLIQREGGTIEAYDGDRVMGIFLGDGKESAAVRAGALLHAAVRDLINPQFAQVYAMHRELKYTVGIDTGAVLACKAGVRGESELVWIGQAANFAAKLNSFPALDHDYPMRVTESVLMRLEPGLRQFVDGSDAWEGPYNNVGVRHYRSLGYLALE